MSKFARSQIKFPNGHETTRVFRWQGIDSNICALAGAAVERGGAFSIRPATPEEVAAATAAMHARKRLEGVS